MTKLGMLGAFCHDTVKHVPLILKGVALMDSCITHGSDYWQVVVLHLSFLFIDLYRLDIPDMSSHAILGTTSIAYQSCSILLHLCSRLGSYLIISKS